MSNRHDVLKSHGFELTGYALDDEERPYQLWENKNRLIKRVGFVVLGAVGSWFAIEEMVQEGEKIDPLAIGTGALALDYFLKSQRISPRVN